MKQRLSDEASLLADRINNLPKWARHYIHNIETFVGAPEVQELTFLRDQNRQLAKLIAEQKADIRRLTTQLKKACKL